MGKFEQLYVVTVTVLLVAVASYSAAKIDALTKEAVTLELKVEDLQRQVNGVRFVTAAWTADNYDAFNAMMAVRGIVGVDDVKP